LSIDRLINSLPLTYDDNYYFDLLFKQIPAYDPDEKIRKVDPRNRMKTAMLPPETRKHSFDEVEQVFSAQEAVAEAERCLRCYQVATIAV
jgi:formate dehydrogenase beta subunit